MTDRAALPGTGRTYASLRPLVLMLAAMAAFAVMSALFKLSADGLPGTQIVFFRCLFALAPLLLWLGLTGRIREALVIRRLQGHLLRSGFGLVSMVTYFTALGLIPLIDITVICYASPLAMVWLSALFLNEPPTRGQAIATITGLGGVLLAAWPQFAARDGVMASQLGASLALVSALAAAAAMTSLRKASATETPASIVFVFLTSAAVITALSAVIIPWQPIGWTTFAMLATAGMFGGVGQLLMTIAYARGALPMVSVMEYTSVIFAAALGYGLFGELPTAHAIVGAALVVAAGFMVAWGATRPAEIPTP